MNIGIVGHEGAKFTEDTRRIAQMCIRCIIAEKAGVPIGGTISPQTLQGITIVSGHCHLGGIDIWAEMFAEEMALPTLIFPPKQLSWERGYKPRNIAIAKNSDEVHVLVARALPESYKGMRFPSCYHCTKRGQKPIKDQPNLEKANGFGQVRIKSGGCWTAWYAVEKLNKPAYWYVIE